MRCLDFYWQLLFQAFKLDQCQDRHLKDKHAQDMSLPMISSYHLRLHLQAMAYHIPYDLESQLAWLLILKEDLLELEEVILSLLFFHSQLIKASEVEAPRSKGLSSLTKFV